MHYSYQFDYSYQYVVIAYILRSCVWIDQVSKSRL